MLKLGSLYLHPAKVKAVVLKLVSLYLYPAQVKAVVLELGSLYLYLGGSNCMVKMRPKLPLHGTVKKESFWGGPKTQEPKIL